MGFLTPATAPTAPFRRELPSMMEASVSTVPAVVSTEPYPALNRGWSSSARTAASTASSAVPPSLSGFQPAATASRIPWRSSSRPSTGSAPAPPWTISAGTRLATLPLPHVSFRRDCRPSSLAGQLEASIARPPRRRLPPLPAVGAPPRGQRRHSTAPLPRPGLLGAAAAGLRRSRGTAPRHGPGSGRSWRQPHRPHVHRRPQRRLAVPRALRGGLRQPADVHRNRRRPPASGRLYHRGASLRASRQ